MDTFEASHFCGLHGVYRTIINMLLQEFPHFQMQNSGYLNELNNVIHVSN